MQALVSKLQSSEASQFPRALATEYDGTARTLWLGMNAAEDRQNFSLPLLQEMKRVLESLRDRSCTWSEAAAPVHYLVLQSSHPEHFSLGGDLPYFRRCIEAGDERGLWNYSKLCLDLMLAWATALQGMATTLALVQGRALGGGFEAALGADFLIAEAQSEFGFPEIMFGLFPCTGAMSLLARRVGLRQAEEMMRSGRIYKAGELKDMGVVDLLCARGDGALAVENFIAEHARRRLPRLALQRARNRLAPLDPDELLAVIDDWVDLAMHLQPEQLHVMEMLIGMQLGLSGR